MHDGGETNKKARDQGPGLFIINSGESAEEDVMIAGPIGQNRWIHDLTTGATFPCVKSSNKIIIFFSVHATFTLGTSHLIISSFINHKISGSFGGGRYYTRRANYSLIFPGKQMRKDTNKITLNLQVVMFL